MATTYDVVIVGGAAIGSAIACFLAKEPAFSGSVLVVEKDPSYRSCASALSVSSIRQQFSTPVNIEISRFGARFLKDAGARLAVDGEAPDIAFVERGYLFMADAAGRAALEANHAVQRAHGAQVALLEAVELAARFPWMRTDDLALGSLGLADEGWFDAYALMQAFRRKALALGVRYLADEVTGLALRGGRIDGVRLAGGEEIACGVLVNAAGYHAARVAAMAGLELPVRPRKRFVYVFDCRTPVPDCPLLIDVNGVYVRPESGHFICGVSPPAEADPDCDDFELDYRLYDEVVWPTLARRVPAFEAIKLINAWACHYDYNTLDQNALLGPHPEVGNFLFANGFSGHGMQQSPAVGRGFSELIAFGEYRSLDLSPLAYGRIAAGAPLHEASVV